MTAFAIVVGINDYPPQTGQRQLAGAAEDACDFADWVLAADGGGVAPENLFFWTHPWPGPSAARARRYPEAPDVMPSTGLAACLVAPTPWVGARGPVVPDASRAPDAREIVDTALVKASELAGLALMGQAATNRIYVFLAGHGVHTNEVSSLEGQTCFLAGDFHSISGNVAHGLVPCDSFRRSLLAGGFGEVFMFLDCCRVQDPVIPMPAAVICAGTLEPARSPWVVGNAAEAGKEAFELPGPPARGAFTAALVEGLRVHRDPGTNALPIASLEAFVTERIETKASGQSPAFEYNPRTKPGPMILVGDPGAPTVSADVTPSRLGRLTAAGGLGVMVRVTDGDGTLLREGVARLDLPLPAGLYAVGWSAAGSEAESIVRVVGGGQTVVRPPWEDDRPVRPSTTALFDIMAQGLPDPDGAESSYDDDSATRPIDRSSLVVELVDPAGGRSGDIMDGLRVLDGVDREVDPVGRDRLPDADGIGVWADVTPGRYRLRFRATSGEVLDQVVPVLKDRTTVVRMQVASATMLVHGSEGFTNVPSRGVDPAQTVIVTTALRLTRAGLDDQLRLARLLLRDLASKHSSLSTEFFDRLDEPGADPLLRIYAALVILNQIEAGLPPALDVEWPDDAPRAASMTGYWCRRAADLLDKAQRAGMPPDATVGLWQVERQVGGHISFHPRRMAASIRMPPMLECAWRWAIARTTIDRHALQDFASIRAAAKTAGGTSPWLCWSAAAAKGLETPVPPASDDELVALLMSVAGKARQLRERQERTRSSLISPHSLPAEATVTALRAEQALDEADGDGRRAPPSAVAALSVALSLPLAVLAARLALTENALDQALAAADTQDTGSNRIVVLDAPGWKRKVRFNDDPNRGRFGGLARHKGFEIAADFSQTKSKNWATIHLVLTGPAGFDGAAVIYLHNSFKPPRHRYRFKDGVARAKVTAWGGFTVGAWIPSHGIELELDLAKVDGAPRIIRER